MQKKILIVTPNLKSSGGVTTFLNSLLKTLCTKKNLNIQTLEVGGHGKNILGPIIDQWNFRYKIKNDIELAFINPSLGFKSFFRDALFTKQLVHKKIPFIIFFHGWNIDFEKNVESKYISFFLSTYGNAKKIFVLSEDFKKKIVEWGYKGEVIIETTMVDSSLVSNFCINDRVKQQQVEGTKILFLSRLIREKGVFELVDAFTQLYKNKLDIKLIIAGDGPDLGELKEYIENRENIDILGNIVGQDKIKAFLDCDIYCLPSYSEGLPISILEAMAFGLPVITTYVGGIKRFFKDPEMGFFVQVKNDDDLFKKLQQILSNKTQMLKMGQFNYNYAHKHLLDTEVSERIYNQIISIKNIG